MSEHKPLSGCQISYETAAKFEEAWAARPWITGDESDKDRAFRWWKAGASSLKLPAAPTDGWRPIESAPKDGTFVLLYSPDSERNPFIGQWIEDNDYPDGGAWWSDCECSGFSIDADPAHFMPLPAPPAKQEAAE